MTDYLNDLLKSNSKKLNLLMIAGVVGAAILKSQNDKIRALTKKVEELANTKGE